MSDLSFYELRATAAPTLPDPGVARTAYAEVMAMRKAGLRVNIASVDLIRADRDETRW